MSGLLILILIFIGLPLLWKWLKPYFFRWAQHRTEDYIRSQMGMPPRDRSRQKSGFSQRQDERSQRDSYSQSGYGGGSGRGRRTRSYSHGPLIPKEYAVDVEYTEIHSYSSEDAIASDGRAVRYAVESQVSDAEIIEIRRDR